MFPGLLILFIVVPLMELLVIIEIGSRIGFLYTIVLLILISFSGAALAKREGYRAIAQIQADVAAGRMPADSLIDSTLILLAAALLIVPGYITDVAGLALLLPPARRLARKYVRKRVRSAVEARTFRVWPGGPPPGGSGAAGGQEAEQRRKEIED